MCTQADNSAAGSSRAMSAMGVLYMEVHPSITQDITNFYMIIERTHLTSNLADME